MEVLYSKQVFINYKNIGFKTHKIGIFRYGLVHGFGEKFEILITFLFIQNTPKKVFGDLLVRKQAFLDNKIMDLKNAKLVKKLKFFHLLCLSKIDGEKVFADVLDTKETFKDYKNICL